MPRGAAVVKGMSMRPCMHLTTITVVGCRDRVRRRPSQASGDGSVRPCWLASMYRQAMRSAIVACCGGASALLAVARCGVQGRFSICWRCCCTSGGHWLSIQASTLSICASVSLPAKAGMSET